MSAQSIILLGGPDTGKTNFIGRLWVTLQAPGSVLSTSGLPSDIKYVEDAVEHLYQGTFTPRTDKNLEADQGSIRIPLVSSECNEQDVVELVIPDMSGEIWKTAVETRELPPARMAQLGNAVGALLFVRVLSPLNVSPVDWVNAESLMEYQGPDADPTDLPTQVMLCEFLRFLELTLRNRTTGHKSRVAVIVTAWDLLDDDRAAAGPRAYLEKEYPLFYGRLGDLDRFDIGIFATSVFGGDPIADVELRDRFLDTGLQSAGYVRFDDQGTVEERNDISFPVAWTIRNCLTL